MTRTRIALLVSAAVAIVGLVPACATNPVTGKKQLALITEAQELAMGREADREISASYGLYPDEALQAYVQKLGAEMAARTERPSLPWTFRVIDDAAVNAFATPGGYIYITRGILTHLNSEAELAAILGHEIGHVTARHSVTQMSQQQLAQIGLVAGMIASPEFAQYGQLAQMGLSLLFLKFSRQDEVEADQLGFRYMTAGGFHPQGISDVFRMLDALGRQEGNPGRLPEWMSTHPDPGNRLEWAQRAVASVDRDMSGMITNRPSYLRRIDGLVFGENPREGFFQAATFRHPDLAFQLQFPAGWKGSNEKQAVGAMSPNQDAVVVLQLAPGTNARQAAEQFFSTQQDVAAGPEWRREIGGFPAYSCAFQAQSGQSMLGGLAAWVEYGGRVYRLLGYTLLQQWPAYRRTFEQSIGSFRRETDPAVLNARPRRLNLVSVPRPATLEALQRDYPSTVPAPVLSLINNRPPTATFAAGDLFKRVTGGTGW